MHATAGRAPGHSAVPTGRRETALPPGLPLHTVQHMLPEVNTDEEWDAVVPDEAVMRPGAEDLCARLGLAGAPSPASRKAPSRCTRSGTSMC